jgi:ubiquinone/menaquinone biosynthesis C-methylase UbiE
MSALQKLKRNWEGLAQADPLWAICTDPERRNRKWDREEFFATGENEMSCVFDCLSPLPASPDSTAPALDFGCGVGRLTRAMASRFPECWGVDISPRMIELARQLNADKSSCRFLLNDEPDLRMLGDNYFGFIYSSIVLQHIPPRYSSRYLLELIRALKPGGLMAFQVLDEFRAAPLARFRERLALRRRARKVFGRNGDHTMELHLLREARIRQLVSSSGASVIDVRFTNSAEPSFNGRLQYLPDAPANGYVSKQYVVTKR